MRFSTKAWISLVGFIAVIEVIAPKDDMLSHAVDDLMKTPHGKAAAFGVIGVTAAHLLNLIPEKYERYDPYCAAFIWKR